MRDTRMRSWTKSMTWRVMGIFILMGLGYLFTGNLAEASLITLSFHALRVVLYYVHERAWEHVEWGRSKQATRFWFWFWLGILMISFALVIVLPSVI